MKKIFSNKTNNEILHIFISIFTFCFSIGSMIYLILYLKSILPYEAFVVLMGLILLEVIVIFFYFLINGFEKTIEELSDIFRIKEQQ
ncbi:TPA: hypothetical protein RQJ16_001800 [Campylobacter fetus subsp. venerealis]|nr:hypothetical protein [Campylobacter fetus subsp. venerealis]HDX8135953.1 hypothetical protein [Campylobacter fetus subsp. venerealis]